VPRLIAPRHRATALSVAAYGAVFVTDDPEAAATWTAFLLYPLAALATERLAARLGASPLAAWLAGLCFALGPFRVPAHLQTVQYANVFLPLDMPASCGSAGAPGPAQRAHWPRCSRRATTSNTSARTTTASRDPCDAAATRTSTPGARRAQRCR
jgi:hypothetical protein